MINRFGNYVNAANAAFVQSPNRPWVVGGGIGLGIGHPSSIGKRKIYTK